MFKPYKRRTIELGQLVKVYYNLHKHTFSIKDKKTGVILGHSSVINILNALFQVNQNGRNKVLAEKRKNVHAYVTGKYLGTELIDDSEMIEVYYNPYETKDFIEKISLDKVDKAQLAICKNKQVLIWNKNKGDKLWQ